MTDLFKLAETLDFSGFSATPPEPDISQWEYVNSDPITLDEFLKKLPDAIIDPKNGKKVMLGSTVLKTFHKEVSQKRCPQRYREDVLHKDRANHEDDSMAIYMGHRFEFLVTGQSSGSGKEAIVGKRGKPLVSETTLQENAKLCKELLTHFGIGLEGTKAAEAQWGILIKCCSYNLDLKHDQSRTIIDLKYSGHVGDRAKWKSYGWHPETIRDLNKTVHEVQARHYVLGVALSEGSTDWYNFEFWVSKSNSEGYPTIFKLSMTDQHMYEHMHFVLKVAEEMPLWLEENRTTCIPSYSNCNENAAGMSEKCPLAESCTGYEKFPKKIEL